MVWCLFGGSCLMVLVCQLGDFKFYFDWYFCGCLMIYSCICCCVFAAVLAVPGFALFVACCFWLLFVVTARSVLLLLLLYFC